MKSQKLLLIIPTLKNSLPHTNSPVKCAWSVFKSDKERYFHVKYENLHFCCIYRIGRTFYRAGNLGVVYLVEKVFFYSNINSRFFEKENSFQSAWLKRSEHISNFELVSL